MTGRSPEGERLYRILWAKTDPMNQAPLHYHALATHLMDVAAVTHEIWKTALSPYRRRQWTAELRVDESLAGRWLAFLAGCHDLGKASVTFQQKAPVQMARLLAESVGAVRSYSGATPIPHGSVTAGTLENILVRRLGLTRQAARRASVITGGHHGRVPSAVEVAQASVEKDPESIGLGIWEIARDDLVAYLAAGIGLPDALPESLQAIPLSYPSAMRLAGLVSVADWVGSDEECFPFSIEVPIPTEAFALSTMRAQAALRHHGWIAPSVALPAGSMSETFPWLTRPKPGQVAAMDAIGNISGPAIVVVEYPMGWGKTEIALWAAARWAERDGIDGFYVAMPTRTTSDQLYSRASALFDIHHEPDAERPNLRRISGLAPLSTMRTPDGIELDSSIPWSDTVAWDIEKGARPTGESDADRERERRSTWFEQRNRGLLARYGVGTIDQAMLSVMLTRHHFVRLEGLAGKTVILDEVHAYDTYMASIVDELIGWLGVLGNPVVILTATLPKKRTDELVEAYRKGAGWDEIPISYEPYPRLTVRDERTATVRHVPATDERRVTLRPVPMPALAGDIPWSNLGPQLQERLAAGGTAAVICNTVSQAQVAYTALRDHFDIDDLTLFHARFRRRERRTIQDSVLARFGPHAHDDHTAGQDGVCNRRHVVVATQVIEQSLDLDFDVMVSVLCPIDLLLQRSGRLHRHERGLCPRPASVAQPEFWITGFTATTDDGTPRFAPGSDAVYGRYPLLRTWWALRDRDEIVIPDDVEQLIELVYGPDVDRPADPQRLKDWEQSLAEFEEQSRDDEAKGKAALIRGPRADNPEKQRDVFSAQGVHAASAEDLPPEIRRAGIHTRLGPPSIDVILLRANDPMELRTAVTATGQSRLDGRTIDELIERSVSISMQGAVAAITSEVTPSSWKRIPFLRHARPVVLGDDGRRTLATGLTLSLHPELGVILERPGARNNIRVNQEEDE